GKRGKTEIPQRSEEAQVPPRGKRVTVAQWNEGVETNQRDGNSECSSFRSNHFAMSQTLYILKRYPLFLLAVGVHNCKFVSKKLPFTGIIFTIEKTCLTLLK
ncbi:hypothetical protein, partial [Priestia flexa]|uniref:hypothetical protein n=1 Tax=Priestia flexa TaxID=86664 RepID=UPI003CFD561E